MVPYTGAKSIGRVTVKWLNLNAAWSRPCWQVDVFVDGAFCAGCTHSGTLVEAMNYVRTQVIARADWDVSEYWS